MQSSGKIAPAALPGVFRELYLARRTGMLRFSLGTDHCAVRFVQGHIVYGEASPRELHLGSLMVAHGMLSQADLERASEIVIRERKRLGQALMDLGIIDHDQLEQALALHAREILVQVLGWCEGDWTFIEQDPETTLRFDFPLKASTGEVILEAARRITDQEAIRFALGDRERVVLPATEPLLRFQRLTLTPVDGFVLSRVDGTMSIRETVEITPLPAPAVEASLFALLLTGILEHAPDRKPEPRREAAAQFLYQEIVEMGRGLPNRNHFEVLGVPTHASDTEIKAAFLRLAKRFHPDVHHDPALTALRDRLEMIFFRLNEAYQVLSNPQTREAYLDRIDPSRRAAKSKGGAPGASAPSSTSPPVRPEDVYQRAEDRFHEGRYWEAVALLGEVVAMSDGRLRLRARTLLARAYLKYPESMRKAEQELHAVIQEDPEQIDAHFQLGVLYRQLRQPARAVAAFRRVLELRPRHREAVAELETLERGGTTGDRPGLFKRLLGG